jgi:hypothetical protein
MPVFTGNSMKNNVLANRNPRDGPPTGVAPVPHARPGKVDIAQGKCRGG